MRLLRGKEMIKKHLEMRTSLSFLIMLNRGRSRQLVAKKCYFGLTSCRLRAGGVWPAWNKISLECMASLCAALCFSWWHVVRLTCVCPYENVFFKGRNTNHSFMCNSWSNGWQLSKLEIFPTDLAKKHLSLVIYRIWRWCHLPWMLFGGVWVCALCCGSPQYRFHHFYCVGNSCLCLFCMTCMRRPSGFAWHVQIHLLVILAVKNVIRTTCLCCSCYMTLNVNMPHHTAWKACCVPCSHMTHTLRTMFHLDVCLSTYYMTPNATAPPHPTCKSRGKPWR